MNEHDIDWSKAPEGTTHKDSMDDTESGWMRYDEGVWYCSSGGHWLEYELITNYEVENNFILRPTDDVMVNKEISLKVTLEDILKIISSNKYVQFWLCNGNYHAKIGSNLNHSGDILVGEEAITEAIIGEVNTIDEYTSLEKELEGAINKVEEIKRKMEELK